MSSRSSSHAASPWWVPLDPSAGESAPAARPRPVAAPPVGERSPAPRAVPRFEGAARRRSELRAALLLVLLWVGLWAVFTAGVVLPAAAVHGAPAAPAERAAP
jgi:hypothetical protein